MQNRNLFKIITIEDIQNHQLSFHGCEKIWVCSLNLIRELLVYENVILDVSTGELIQRKFPINKNKAIERILNFIEFIDFKMIIHDNYELELHVKYFQKYFTKAAYYKSFKNILHELKVLTMIPHKDGKFTNFSYNDDGSKNLKNIRACLYRVHNNYIKDDICLVVKKGRLNPQKITNNIEEINSKFLNTIKNIRIDIKAAFRAEIENYKINNLNSNVLKTRLQFLFDLLYKNRYIKKGQQVERIYHSISNLSRVSRSFLTINNKSFYDIDVRNCQPLLLIYYLKYNNYEVDQNYIEDCEKALFYSQFYKIYNSNNLSIDDCLKKIKKDILSCVFFGFYKNNKTNKQFKSLYPKLYNSLENIHSNETNLAIHLQNLESEVFNNLSPKKSKHFFTIFDSIYFDNIMDKEDLTNQIITKFKTFGLNAQVKFSG